MVKGKTTMGQTCFSSPASPRYAKVRPTYIGFRVKRYGPQVTSFADTFPGTVVVRALRKSTKPQPAITPPTANSTPPATVVTSALSAETVRGCVCSKPTPRRYDRTNTQGTGTRISNRTGFIMPHPLPSWPVHSPNWFQGVQPYLNEKWIAISARGLPYGFQGAGFNFLFFYPAQAKCNSCIPLNWDDLQTLEKIDDHRKIS